MNLRLSGTGYDTDRKEVLINNQMELGANGTRYNYRMYKKAKRNVRQDKEKNGSQQDVNDWLMPQLSVKITQCCVA